MMMRHSIYTILPLLAIILFTSCKEKTAKEAAVLRPVKYEVVGTATAQKTRTFSGIARAGDEIELSFRSNGIITALHAKAGQQVKEGDLIAKLDNVQANLAYEQSVSALNSARSAMKTAKAGLDRTKSLYEKGSKSLSDYEQAKNSYQAASDQYESAKRNKSIQQSQINYGIIRAPKDGIIALKNSELNENVSAGQVIAVLNAGDEINVVVGLPENVINTIQLGLQTVLTFSAIKDEQFEGSIIEIAPVIDANSATYPVKIDIIKPAKAIKPGMAANVTFNLGGPENASGSELVVPVNAVGEDGNGNFVFVIESSDGETGQVKKQTVEIGALTTSGFKIKSGLSKGDKIATAGLQTLLNGQKVRLQ